jgi:hypothetical protein
MVVDFLMHIKTPAKGLVGKEYQCNDAAILFHVMLLLILLVGG